MQIKPNPENLSGSHGPDLSLLLDAQDEINWANDLIGALLSCGDRSTTAVAHHAIERLQRALHLLKSVQEGAAA